MSGNFSIQFTQSFENTWKAILNVIQQNINKRSFSTWFAPVKALNISDDIIEVKVPNRFFCEWIDNHYADLLQNAIAQVLGDARKVKYIVDDHKPNETSPYHSTDWQASEPPVSVNNHNSDLPFSTRINERYHFDNFIIG